MLVVAGLIGLATAGCSRHARLTVDHQRVASTAYTATSETALARRFPAPSTIPADESGFVVLPSGHEAFDARVKLAALAEHSIDAQYYIWKQDESAFMIGDALLRAADRGIRVRILIDDFLTKGRDVGLATFDAHPNVQIRVFNPFSMRRARVLDLLTSMYRLDHRMHNKLFTVDGGVSILGGRNIGNEYFGVSPIRNYRDLDVLTVGAVVAELGASFDDYWNSDWAIPIHAFVDEPDEEASFRAAVAEARRRPEIVAFPYPTTFTDEALDRWVRAIGEDLLYGRVAVLVDDPDKAESKSTALYDRLREFGDEVQQHVTVANPYLVPDDRMFATIEANVRRGMSYRVLTNSAGSNNVTAVHAAYARRRQRLLTLGIELYELRSDAEELHRHWSHLARDSTAVLHEKILTADGRFAFVGSYNADPRSRDINTELGVLIHSPAFVSRIDRFIAEGMTASNSYRVELDDRGRVTWTTVVDGQPVRYTSEPHTSAWRRFVLWTMGLLPIAHKL